jgi:hypothetical protein
MSPTNTPKPPLQEVQEDLGQVGPSPQTVVGVSARLLVLIVSTIILVIVALGGIVLTHLPQPQIQSPAAQNQP